MNDCNKCGDQKYIVSGCCNGFECGCMGKPVELTNCSTCNPNDDKPMGDTLASNEYVKHLEFVLTTVKK